ncbi:hypothetical protein FEM48_Zijuj05G0017500 [Ziziphus jujuba var. spinosa]|uniref:Leucine-rich repeat-containing N-terminal plant-type domain-containing protein n=1 Tax=Ziziphus jujuba var. spinosa TaxID=714518 RepID=A0A978VC32_ZIZJJ|nr:hypothetical protein FEM48_Zijuj05G0017500 [Ziziphus jujuba var. spinosa]
MVNCLDSDKEALMDFKTDLHDPENRLSSWKGSNCCQWQGISCNNTTGAVIAVDLHNPHGSSSRHDFWSLSGEIRPSLTKLKSLRHLDLSFSTFNDNLIPEFFGYLKDLQYLNLSNAGFSGALPPNLGNLSSLQYLDIESLDLLVHNLEWATGLVSLRHLIMNEVNLSMYYEENVVLTMKGQSRIFNKILNLVVCLDLSGNNLTGDLPGEITKLLGLVFLNLSRNHISGHIPKRISELKQLSSLDLSSNKFTGAIPQSMASLSSLGYMNLSNKNFSGRIPYKDHLTTFEASSFAGNPGLCGDPLTLKCPGDDPDKYTTSGESGDSFVDKWFYFEYWIGICGWNSDNGNEKILEYREALTDFKNGLHDPENRLSSWEGSNCCQWWGISCENTTGAVISVDLHNPYPEAEAGLDSSGRPYISKASCDE